MKTVVDFIKKTFNDEGFIPLHIPRFIGNEKEYLNECIDSTFVSSVGKFVDTFEEKIAKYTGAKHAIVVVNGTEALHVSLRLAGVNYNDEVITQPLTFVATTNAISYLGATPVFVDVDKETLGLSPQKLFDFLRENTEKRSEGCFNMKTSRYIKACVPMHTFGHPCLIESIKNICDEYKIELVEDSAESIGSYYKGKHTGNFGRFGIISFNGNKVITTGGGGVILSNNAKDAKAAKHLTTQAKVAHPWEYVHDDIGYNYRMPNINAALGLAQLEKLDLFLTKKRELAKKYDDFFSNTKFQFFSEPKECKSNYWLNAILLNDLSERDSFLEYTNKNGVMTRPVWKLMNNLKMFKNCQHGDLSNSEYLADRIINIPSSVIL